MIKMSEVRVGSIVRVRGDFGTGPAKEARVDYVDSDIKNGREGIDYTVLADGDERWAYLTQVDSVVTY